MSEDKRKRGRPKTGRRTTVIGFSGSPELAAELKTLAEQGGVSLSRQVETMLRQQMESGESFPDYHVMLHRWHQLIGEHSDRPPMLPTSSSLFVDVESEQILLSAALIKPAPYAWTNAIGAGAFQSGHVHSDAWRYLSKKPGTKGKKDSVPNPQTLATSVLTLGNLTARRSRLTEYYKRLQRIGPAVERFAPVAAERLMQSFSTRCRSGTDRDASGSGQLPFVELERLEAHVGSNVD